MVSNSENKSARIDLRCTPFEKSFLQWYSSKCGFSLSEYMLLSSLCFNDYNDFNIQSTLKLIREYKERYFQEEN